MACRIFYHTDNCDGCRQLSFISNPKSRCWSDKNNLKPYQVSKWNTKKFLFDCDICFHTFLKCPQDVSYGVWCPYCVNKKLCENKECETCFKKSFASHPKSKFWDYEKNENIIPRDVFLNSGKKCWFNCEICTHSFSIIICDVTREIKNTWCPYCANQKICVIENSEKICEYCYKKTFASHEKSKFWDYEKNKIHPSKLFLNSRKKYWFNCENCVHAFATRLSNVKNGCWCPYCSSPPKKLCLVNQDKICKQCYEKSFALHPKSKFWDYEKNKIHPSNVFMFSHDKYHFICEKGHKFFTAIRCITKNFSWCPHCVNKMEDLVYTFLDIFFDGEIVRQYKPSWCVSNMSKLKLPFDFFIPAFNLIIEIDGPQHFKQIKGWISYKYNQTNDLYKTKLAIDNGISILRIPCDFFDARNVFKTQTILFQMLENIKKYDSPRIILMTQSVDDSRYSYIENFDFSGGLPLLSKKSRVL